LDYEKKNYFPGSKDYQVFRWMLVEFVKHAASRMTEPRGPVLLVGLILNVLLLSTGSIERVGRCAGRCTVSVGLQAFPPCCSLLMRRMATTFRKLSCWHLLRCQPYQAALCTRALEAMHGASLRPGEATLSHSMCMIAVIASENKGCSCDPVGDKSRLQG
jgi:hypothetical protein